MNVICKRQVGSLLLLTLAACTDLSSPAVREARLDGGAEITDAQVDDGATPAFDAAGRCAVLEQNASRDEPAALYAGNEPNTNVLLISGLYTPSPETAPGNLFFEVALAGKIPATFLNATFDLSREQADGLTTCAFCVVLHKGCDGSGANCRAVYVPVSGGGRALQVNTTAGAPVWVEIANVEFARADVSDALGIIGIHRDDCIFSGRTLFLGTTDSALTPCAPDSKDIGCAIARTASMRTP